LRRRRGASWKRAQPPKPLNWLKGAAAKLAVKKGETVASVLEEPARGRLLALLRELGLAPVPVQRAFTAPARVELPPGVRAPGPLYSPAVEPGAPWWRQPLIVDPRVLESGPLR
jgi:hypothetical protein